MKLTSGRRRFLSAAVLCLVALGGAMRDLGAQQVEPSPAPERLEAARRPLVNADETRSQLMELLQRHPPAVGRVLKLDPALMRNEAYLSAYPALQEFLAAHPDVSLNAAYYLEPVRGVNDVHIPTTPHVRVVENTLQALAVLTGIAIVAGSMLWLIRTMLEQRRWSRLSRIQAEVHTKLMDRFSSNDELLAYVQMPAGRRFLESGPSPLQEMSPAVSAPFSRILWSVQLGAILLVTGLGLLFLSNRVLPEMRDFFYIMGCLATALGAGFSVSALAAYVLSRRLGLIDPPASTHA